MEVQEKKPPAATAVVQRKILRREKQDRLVITNY